MSSTSMSSVAIVGVTSSRTDRHLHSFPTRRSSDLNTHLWEESWDDDDENEDFSKQLKYTTWPGYCFEKSSFSSDRKSTRLNSSHLGISYAVFCLNKKNLPEQNFDLNLFAHDDTPEL